MWNPPAFWPPMLESAALFSLSCTPIYQLLGKRLEAFKVDEDTRFKFLVTLE